MAEICAYFVHAAPKLPMYKSPFLFIICAFVCVHVASGQQNVTDSLANAISTLPNDSSKVKALNDLVTKLQYANPSKAAAVVEKSIQLAQKINYPLGLVTAYRLRGVLYIDRSVLDSGKLFYDKAFALAKGKDDKPFKRQLGLLTHNYGVIFHHGQQYDSATAYYLRAASTFKSIGEESLCYFPYANLSTIYTFLKDYSKALAYAREMAVAARAFNDENKISFAVNQEIAAKLLLKQYDSIYNPLLENIRRAKSVQNLFTTSKAYNLMAIYYSEAKSELDSGIYYRKNAVTLMEKLGNRYELAGLLQDLGFDHKRKGDYKAALTHLKRATAMAKENGMSHVLTFSLLNLAETEEARGNNKAALEYMKEYVSLNDSIQELANREQVNELEAKYQAANKALQIRELEAEKQSQALAITEKNNLNLVLAIVIAAGVIISILLYRAYRQKQRLQQQRIAQLENEKQLNASEAVLKGEERERTRLAKDLHDGLGGMLSGIKYGLQTMKENLIMTPENSRAFERSLDMLDTSIREMRRVAHNMMPEALVKFGLDSALRDYCNDINQSGVIDITYQSYGMEKLSINQTLAITAYRIVQELINNTIKHASAKKAIVQLTTTDQQLVITVEDDGKGFDTAILQQPVGMGWSNIQHRTEFLKGKLDVISQPGKGTSVQIEFAF